MERYCKCRIQLTCLIKQNLWCFNFTALPAPNSTNLVYCLYLDRACGRHGRRAVENYTTAPESTATNITSTNNIIISHMKLDVNSISQQITPLTVHLMALSMRTWVGQFPLGSPPAHLPAKNSWGSVERILIQRLIGCWAVTVHLLRSSNWVWVHKVSWQSCLLDTTRMLTSSTGVSVVKQRSTCTAPADSDDPRLHTTTWPLTYSSSSHGSDTDGHWRSNQNSP